MLYLFLTGSRSAYLNAIFTVLHFPQNTIYDLKYKLLSKKCIVADSAGVKKCKIGEKVLILFDDKKGKYIPLRFGVLRNCVVEDGQIYYSVKLTDYCHVKDEVLFLDFINKSALPEKIRTIKDKSNNTAEGILTFQHKDDNDNISKALDCKTDSWIQTVMSLGEAMQKMDIFRRYYLIFTKMEIKKDNGKNLLSSKEGRINLKSGKDYKFHITYYIPKFNDSPMEVISAKFYQSHECLGLVNTGVALLSQQNKADVICSPRASVTETKKVRVGFEISNKKANNKIIQYVRTPLELNLKTRMPRLIRYLMIVGCIAISVVGTCLAGLTAGEDAANLITVSKIVGGLFTALSTLGMIHLIGKPKL